VEGGQAGRIGGGLDPNDIQKGGIYWYIDGQQVEVVDIDRSLHPPSFVIRFFDGRERETEAHRLFLMGNAAIANTAHDVHREEGPPAGGANRALGSAFNSGGMSQYEIEALASLPSDMP
jgi:hypothetical protein